MRRPLGLIRPRSPGAPLVLGLMIALAAGCLGLGGCHDAEGPPSDAGLCWIGTPRRGFRVLDGHSGNLETCGARLEVAYLRQRRPVEGAYGGVYIFIDDREIDAQAPNGPRERLFDPQTRAVMDRFLAELMSGSTPQSSAPWADKGLHPGDPRNLDAGQASRGPGVNPAKREHRPSSP